MDKLTTETSAWEEILTRFLAFLPSIVAALVIFVATLYLANLISRILQRHMEKRQVDAGWTVLITLTIRWGLILMGTVATLRQVNFDLTGFLAGLGIVGFTIGFALQDISRNTIAGMLLLVQKPFEIGDSVKIADFTGRIHSVNMRSTELVTSDGNNVFIPNGNVFTLPIINYSRLPTRRMELTIGVAYESDLELVRQTTLAAIRSIPNILPSPAPLFFFHTFNTYSIDFTVRFWIDTQVTDTASALDPVIVALQQAYARQNISIPYPIQTELTIESGQKEHGST